MNSKSTHLPLLSSKPNITNKPLSADHLEEEALNTSPFQAPESPVEGPVSPTFGTPPSPSDRRPSRSTSYFSPTQGLYEENLETPIPPKTHRSSMFRLPHVADHRHRQDTVNHHTRGHQGLDSDPGQDQDHQDENQEYRRGRGVR